MRLLWLPDNKKASFTITDDTDKATLKTVKAVYDLMAELGLKTTKTVWPFRPKDLSGIPSQPDYWSGTITLEDKDYLDYCHWLADQGFEICLHGASCGNNLRKETLAALNLIKGEGFSTRTYICHSKNAENPYWENNIFSSPLLRSLLAKTVRYRTYGENPKDSRKNNLTINGANSLILAIMFA